MGTTKIGRKKVLYIKGKKTKIKLTFRSQNKLLGCITDCTSVYCQISVYSSRFEESSVLIIYCYVTKSLKQCLKATETIFVLSHNIFELRIWGRLN